MTDTYQRRSDCPSCCTYSTHVIGKMEADPMVELNEDEYIFHCDQCGTEWGVPT